MNERINEPTSPLPQIWGARGKCDLVTSCLKSSSGLCSVRINFIHEKSTSCHSLMVYSMLNQEEKGEETEEEEEEKEENGENEERGRGREVCCPALVMAYQTGPMQLSVIRLRTQRYVMGVSSKGTQHAMLHQDLA